MTPPIPEPQPSSSDSSHRFLLRRAAIAPLCLCLVAGLHAVRVLACGQTQWKGGGFGMFSTVDSETSRFVRAFAVTAQGELPLAIPSHLDKAVAELRAAPTQAKVESVARRLAATRWRRPDERMLREAQRWLPEQRLSASLPLPERGLFRSLEASPASASADGALGIHAVRVECWRLGLDCGTRNATEGVPYSAVLHSELIREATAESSP